MLSEALQIFCQVKQQDLAKAIRCLCGRFKIFDEAGYHNLAPDINNFDLKLNHYKSGNINAEFAFMIIQPS